MLRYTKIGINIQTFLLVVLIIVIIVIVENLNSDYKEEVKYNNEYKSTAIYNEYDAYTTYYNYYMSYVNKITNVKLNIPKLIIPRIGLSIDVSKTIINKNEYAIQKNNRWLEVNGKYMDMLQENDTVLYLANGQTYVYTITSIQILEKVDYSIVPDLGTLIITQNTENSTRYIQATK